MAPYKQPGTLFTLAKERISTFIGTDCVVIDKIYKECDQDILADPVLPFEVQELHDALLTYIPPSMNNFICESVLAWNDANKLSEKCDTRILYGVLVNEYTTSLKVRGRKGRDLRFFSRHVVPRLANLVKLDVRLGVSHGRSGEVVFAVSETCRKLAVITLPITTSTAAFHSLVKSCRKLQTVFGSGCEMDLKFAIANLPDLEFCDDRNMGKVLACSRVCDGSSGALKLRNVYEAHATPSMMQYVVDSCPHLEELDLTPEHIFESSEIFRVLSSKRFKITKLALRNFCLSDANAERFLRKNCKHVEDLHIDYCRIADVLNFITFLGVCCKNLRSLTIHICVHRATPSFMFTIPADKTPSFLHLASLNIVQDEAYTDFDYTQNERQILTTLISTAPCLEKIKIRNGKWKRGYPSDNAIEEMFPVSAMTKLGALTICFFEMTQRTARYFLNNTPSLTYFLVPMGTTEPAIDYIQHAERKFRKQNMQMRVDYQAWGN